MQLESTSQYKKNIDLSILLKNNRSTLSGRIFLQFVWHKGLHKICVHIWLKFSEVYLTSLFISNQGQKNAEFKITLMSVFSASYCPP